ncbi:hypothetical protein [Curtobacterium sp. 1544]|uniref:hypothetical protein n=1 Tax=Curtobacterium sp. 1544 TaxID=3156417 RepID=UPI003393B383
MTHVATRQGARVELDRKFRAFAASCNAESQEDLMRTLVAALADARADLDVLADRLGAEPEMLREMFEGDRDVNLNELRLLASAMNIVVHYRVTPAPVEWYRREQDLLAARASRRVGREHFLRSHTDIISSLLRSKDDNGVHV